ncbi:hypothetical protein GCM10023323_21640 [Streptomyces thinghirensis]|uniref:Uncharacterized protein n=1 Tax=Streptomyces thinghirensis TaxID=551547 RepID=A0ABP9T2F1_9ACTN
MELAEGYVGYFSLQPPVGPVLALELCGMRVISNVQRTSAPPWGPLHVGNVGCGSLSRDSSRSFLLRLRPTGALPRTWERNSPCLARRRGLP